MENGISISIESKTSPSNNLLKIVGKSRCLEKPKYIIDVMMKARVQDNINKCNLDDLDFTSLPKGFCTKVEHDDSRNSLAVFHKVLDDSYNGFFKYLDHMTRVMTLTRRWRLFLHLRISSDFF